MAPGWDAAEYAADCHFCGALSKKYTPFLGCAVPAKKSGACACATGFFYCLRKLFFSLCEYTSVNTPV